MQISTSKSKSDIKPFFCKHHQKEKVQRINTDGLTKDSLKCVECLLVKDKKDKIPKETLLSFDKFIEQAAKLYDLVRNFSTLEDSLPSEFTECLKDEETSVSALKKYIDTEKDKAEAAFSMIIDEFTNICLKKKEEFFTKLDKQVENLQTNFKYYQEKLDKNFGKVDESAYPDKVAIYQKLNACKSYDEADTYVKTLKDDMIEISMYGNDPETRSKELRIALKEFSSAIIKNCKNFPETCFSTNEKANEIKDKLQATVAPLFENILEITHPIDSLSLSETGRIGSLIVTKPEEVKLLRTWCGPGMLKFKLLYRATKDGFASEVFHKKCDEIKPTLTIIKSHNSKVFGGYSDQSWTSTSNYKTSNNLWIFSLDAKEKYKLKNENAHQGVYCNASYGPTFGGGHDIYVCNNSNNTNSCYSNYGYSYETKGMTYSSTQAQSHLAGSYNFKTEEVEVFQLCTNI